MSALGPSDAPRKSTPGCQWTALRNAQMHLTRRAGPTGYLGGSGVNLYPSASVMAANILVAGEEQTLSRGSLARMGDSSKCWTDIADYASSLSG